MKNTSVVVMTEFGRRLYENASLGTDHGRGSIMMVLGGGVKGGKIYGEWPGLEEEQLDGPGDLAVTTNYRNVLASIFEKHGGALDYGHVFPDFPVEPLELYA
jgi:uncharacterized protein (DUF1501 family)